jgi:hypothetical protein
LNIFLAYAYASVVDLKVYRFLNRNYILAILHRQACSVYFQHYVPLKGKLCAIPH